MRQEIIHYKCDWCGRDLDTQAKAEKVYILPEITTQTLMASMKGGPVPIAKYTSPIGLRVEKKDLCKECHLKYKDISEKTAKYMDSLIGEYSDELRNRQRQD